MAQFGRSKHHSIAVCASSDLECIPIYHFIILVRDVDSVALLTAIKRNLFLFLGNIGESTICGVSFGIWNERLWALVVDIHGQYVSLLLTSRSA
ncbi:unnamed protein product [Clonostachys rosea f. rosea IK726]|uniref:Uncharacterized protein n=1 Tax=Clonostachys rosea f. rosea IK726 TaxID=1349383 RepID=A0ACA9TSI5_BIOOC|nr:unnamed protein product [Clonostachys rosea f. rosea IK726]